MYLVEVQHFALCRDSNLISGPDHLVYHHDHYLNPLGIIAAWAMIGLGLDLNWVRSGPEWGPVWVRSGSVLSRFVRADIWSGPVRALPKHSAGRNRSKRRPIEYGPIAGLAPATRAWKRAGSRV
jgi:hypothetical protein